MEGFFDHDYIVQCDFSPDWNTVENHGDILVRYQDPNNAYIVRHVKVGTGDPSAKTQLFKLENGQETFLKQSLLTSEGGTIKVKLSGNTISIYRNGGLLFSETDSTFGYSGVAFAAEPTATVANLKIGYDNNADNDIDDGGDDLVVNIADFSDTSHTPAYDDAGNLVDDGQYFYRYDAWNRLTRVRAKHDDVTIQTAAYDGTGRRIRKVVSNRGDLDATEVYYYDGWKVVEIRDGSGDMDRQFIHGTQYIDEHVMMRARDKGDLYIHQDANWNVIATTDLGGNLMEHYVYEPYGSSTVNQSTSWGDRDGDGDVDATDKGTPGVTCTGTPSGQCRILDLDFDGDYDSTDAEKFDNLTQGVAKKAGRSTSRLKQSMHFKGLHYDYDVDQYQNRSRTLSIRHHRFVEPDPDTYSDGLNLYSPVRQNPSVYQDPYGDTSEVDFPTSFCLVRMQSSFSFWGRSAKLKAKHRNTEFWRAGLRATYEWWSGINPRPPYPQKVKLLRGPATCYSSLFVFSGVYLDDLHVGLLDCHNYEVSHRDDHGHPACHFEAQTRSNRTSVFVAPSIPLLGPDWGGCEGGKFTYGDNEANNNNFWIFAHEISHMMGCGRPGLGSSVPHSSPDLRGILSSDYNPLYVNCREKDKAIEVVLAGTVHASQWQCCYD